MRTDLCRSTPLSIPLFSEGTSCILTIFLRVTSCLDSETYTHCSQNYVYDRLKLTRKFHCGSAFPTSIGKRRVWLHTELAACAGMSPINTAPTCDIFEHIVLGHNLHRLHRHILEYSKVYIIWRVSS